MKKLYTTDLFESTYGEELAFLLKNIKFVNDKIGSNESGIRCYFPVLIRNGSQFDKEMYEKYFEEVFNTMEIKGAEFDKKVILSERAIDAGKRFIKDVLDRYENQQSPFSDFLKTDGILTSRGYKKDKAIMIRIIFVEMTYRGKKGLFTLMIDIKTAFKTTDMTTMTTTKNFTPKDTIGSFNYQDFI